MHAKIAGLALTLLILCGCTGSSPNIVGKWVQKNPLPLEEATAAINEKKYLSGFTEVFRGSTIEFKSGGNMEVTRVENGIGVRFLGNYRVGFGRITLSISSCEPIGQSGHKFDSVNSSMAFAKKLGLLPPLSQPYEIGGDGSMTFIGIDGSRDTWIRVQE